ncbi:hypothetical protein SU69_01905 [Thermosipho melanesiensis]|uniref:Glycosyl transferase, group 1 n=2 Tax=Thermosipho melanesiensis TaxID=46541 RepID=A6LJY3_THEM4|nr:glycosyltransferase family 4 protein [Thermosipho melanesiensis]ABR30234.1 glycosyl transferase, group 1 [Thermosipho melanesiensis BI429]APT73423.1 lipopolysaccharide biosynthesis protein [Thermosipho melanesiensis]OOC37366.1 hypothetical protein SU68_01915 [Thermosipho melanesiensis]OOC39728.1 hypothetical protein SU69_01905 [Thermosipho melanesiensis]OOC39833.1 hypothetical protein SU70_01900 [Thermosipho melanesiensis]
MKILILNHYASIPELSSAETRHFEIGKRLVKKGHKITIAVGNYSHLLKKDWNSLVENDFEKEGVIFKIIKTRKYRGNGLSRFLSSYDFYKNGKKLKNEKFDIVVASSPHPFSWKLGNYISKKQNIPLLIELRDVWPDDLIEAGLISRNHPIVPFFKYMSKKYYTRSSGVISLVPSIEKHLKSITSKKIPMKIIPNGVSLANFFQPYPCKNLDEIPCFKNKTIKIVYTGSHNPSNGLEDVLKCIVKLEENLKNRFTFIFIGSGTEKQKLINMAKNEKNVYFLNPISKSCIPYLLKEKSDVLLFSLKYFKNTEYPAFSSYKLLDYMASGKPILSVDQKNLILKNTNGAIFFTPKDCTSLSLALKKILDKDKIEKMGKNNVEYIKKHRDWDVLSEQFEEFLINVLGG